MAEQNKNTQLEKVGNMAVTNFERFYLGSLGLIERPEDDDERAIAEGALLKVINYCTTNDIKSNTLDQISIITGIKQLIQVGLDPNMPENVYVAVYDGKVQFAPYKNGYIHLFQEYGLGVKKLVDIWEVREGDKFIPPKHVGIKMTDAEYEQNSSYGKVLKTVFVYIDNDDKVRYLISERNNALPSLISAIMNGNRGDKRLDEIITKIKELDDIDEAIEYVKTQKNQWGKYYISPAWRIGTESMIATKMRGYIARNRPTVKFKSPEQANAYQNLIDAEIVPITTQPTFNNDEKVDVEVKEGEVSKTTFVEKEVQVEEEVNISQDFVEEEEVEEPVKLVKEKVTKDEDVDLFKKVLSQEPKETLFDENGEVIEETEINDEVEETSQVVEESGDEDDDIALDWLNS